MNRLVILPATLLIALVLSGCAGFENVAGSVANNAIYRSGLGGYGLPSIVNNTVRAMGNANRQDQRYPQDQSGYPVQQNGYPVQQQDGYPQQQGGNEGAIDARGSSTFHIPAIDRLSSKAAAAKQNIPDGVVVALSRGTNLTDTQCWPGHNCVNKIVLLEPTTNPAGAQCRSYTQTVTMKGTLKQPVYVEGLACRNLQQGYWERSY